MNAILLSALTLGAGLVGQDPTEDDYYRIVPLPIPEALVLEVSGITLLADGRPLVCNRRGEVFVPPRGAVAHSLISTWMDGGRT